MGGEKWKEQVRQKLGNESTERKHSKCTVENPVTLQGEKDK